MNGPSENGPLLIERDHPFEWLRGPATLDGDWIVLDAKRAKSYAPIQEDELMYDLAAVRRPADAVALIGRYGLLRHRGDKERRERWRDIEDDASTLSGVMRCVSLIRDATDGDRQRSNDAIRDLWKLSNRLVTDTGLPRPDNDDDVIRQAMQAVVLIINGELEGVESRIAGFAGGYFAFTADAPTLLAMAYHQLAQAIIARVPMRECAECGRFFEVTDRRQRFCSKTCGGRARQRRFAEKRAATKREAT